jgi:hypothetical protein
MRPFLTILSCLVTTFTLSQTLTDRYLHFKTDYYWDTTLYKSEQVFYFELNNGRIIQKDYPVLQYQFSTIVNEESVIKKDSFERRNFSHHPYQYIRKGEGIYLQYFDLEKQMLKLNKEYSLNLTDRVKWLTNKNTLDSKNGISVGGFSTYLGEVKIELNGKQFSVLRFLENHDEHSSHSSYSTVEVFIEKTSLIPIKFVTTLYDYRTRRKESFSYVTALFFSSNTLPDYSDKKTENLILFENKSTVWTEKQRQEFQERFPLDQKAYSDCLLEKLDGQISYFHYEQNMYFKKLIISKECE